MNKKESLEAKKLGPVIRSLRKSAKKSQGWIAKKIGVSQAVVSKIEKGQLVMSMTSWYKFCDCLKIDPEITFRRVFREPL